MAKPWDDAIKRLIHLRPEAFVRLFLPEAHFIEALSPKLRQERQSFSYHVIELRRDYCIG